MIYMTYTQYATSLGLVEHCFHCRCCTAHLLGWTLSCCSLIGSDSYQWEKAFSTPVSETPNNRIPIAGMVLICSVKRLGQKTVSHVSAEGGGGQLCASQRWAGRPMPASSPQTEFEAAWITNVTSWDISMLILGNKMNKRHVKSLYRQMRWHNRHWAYGRPCAYSPCICSITNVTQLGVGRWRRSREISQAVHS